MDSVERGQPLDKDSEAVEPGKFAGRRHMLDVNNVEAATIKIEPEVPVEPKKIKAKEADYIRIDPLPTVINLRQQQLLR